MISALESLLFAVGEEGITLVDLTSILEKESEEVLELLNKLEKKYIEDENSGIELK